MDKPVVGHSYEGILLSNEKNDMLTHAVGDVDPTNISLNVVSQTPKITDGIISFNIKLWRRQSHSDKVQIHGIPGLGKGLQRDPRDLPGNSNVGITVLNPPHSSSSTPRMSDFY